MEGKKREACGAAVERWVPGSGEWCRALARWRCTCCPQVGAGSVLLTVVQREWCSMRCLHVVPFRWPERGVRGLYTQKPAGEPQPTSRSCKTERFLQIAAWGYRGGCGEGVVITLPAICTRSQTGTVHKRASVPMQTCGHTHPRTDRHTQCDLSRKKNVKGERNK